MDPPPFHLLKKISNLELPNLLLKTGTVDTIAMRIVKYMSYEPGRSHAMIFATMCWKNMVNQANWFTLNQTIQLFNDPLIPLELPGIFFSIAASAAPQII